MSGNKISIAFLALLLASDSASLFAQVAVKGKKVYTVSGSVIENGVVVVEKGKIAAVGKEGVVQIPKGYRVLEAAVVTPGLVDARSVVGLAGELNQKQDQDQLDRSEPIQAELRAVDAYNGRDRLVEWIRNFGVTTVHTGHGPGELISGQTMIVKTHASSVESALVKPLAAVACTLASSARKDGPKSPGSRSKMMAMLRAELIKAREYAAKRANPDITKRPARNLRLDALADVLAKETPFIITAQRAQDIANALRLTREFELRTVLDGVAEAHLMLDEIKSAGVPVLLHPPMERPFGDFENMSFTTAAKLRNAGIPFAFQSGFTSYVPKTRVVLFEAAIAAANGLGMENALRAITLDAAKIIGVDHRVGSIEVGKDGDLALYDGDPFEYTTHCVGVVIEGRTVFRGTR